MVPDMPHWTDPPTGQVPAVLDRRIDEEGNETQWSAAGDTGPAWREHRHEWDDSGFDPSLLADDDTRVGALEETPVEERRPWEFDDLTAAVADEERAETEHEPGAAESWWDEEGTGVGEAAASERPSVSAAAPPEVGPEPDALDRGVASISSSPLRFQRDPAASSPSARGALPRRSVVPPAIPAPGGGRNLPVAIATGLGFALVAVLCFEAGTVATLVLATLVVVLSAAECYASLRRGGKRPATLLGLVATVAVMVSAYSKGIAALPLILMLVVITAMIWYLVGVERRLDRWRASPPPCSVSSGSVFLGSFAALLLAPVDYPAPPRRRLLAGRGGGDGRRGRGRARHRELARPAPLAPHVSPNKTWEGLVGGALVAIAALGRSSPGTCTPGRPPRLPPRSWWSPWSPRSATCASRW